MRKQHALLIKIVITAMMSALTFALTFVSIPFGTSKVHLGNFACLLVSLLFGPLIGGISGSLGMGLNDILLGYPPQTFIRTLIVKFIMGFLCGFLFKKLRGKEKISLEYLVIPSIVFYIISTLLFIAIYNNGTSFTVFDQKITLNIFTPIFASVIATILLLIFIIFRKKESIIKKVAIAVSYATILNICLEFILKVLLNTVFVGSLEAAFVASFASIPQTILTGIVTMVLTPLLYIPLYNVLKNFNYSEFDK